MYFVIVYLSSTDNVDIDKQFLYGAISNALEIWLLVHISSKTSFQFDTCPRLLHKLKNSSNEARLHRTVEIQSVRMYQNRIDFNILGLFSLKYCLLFNMMSEIMTYLVILIQFNTHRMTTTIMTENNYK
ncbi:hypothetical protein WA026_000910 [Henosepilachna vigintioctopunctata]|uniref:Uncharacterized protein n=1 Tax=Henosepilachna vigintioctopunctata TaxID=420089 RepID=A0AAW1V9H7_9CUCU